MKELKDRLKSILISEAKSDAEFARDIGLSLMVFKSYFYGKEDKSRSKTLRIIERYILNKENNDQKR